MEELTNSIRRVCELAQNLQSRLPNLANDPTTLCFSIDEIVNTLSAAKEKLLVFQQDQTPASSSAQMMPHEMKQPQMDKTPIMQEYAQTMDQLFQMQQLQATAPYDVGANFLQSKMMGRVDFLQLRSKGTLQIGDMGGRDVEDPDRSKGSEGEVEAIEASPSRPRRSKKVDLEKRTTMVPAPEFGNTELPPDDGFSWRKYGQKEILGSKYPRSYYRCTHRKLYECLAKKQVQRVDSNPSMFQVTYRGKHTCHRSSTAPSSSVPLPPPQHLLIDMSQDMTTTQSTISTQLSPSSASASGLWLPTMNLSLQVGGGGMAPAAADASSGSAGASTSSRYGGDYPVVDMADAMFNSGSSSGNSMESLFPPTDE